VRREFSAMFKKVSVHDFRRGVLVPAESLHFLETGARGWRLRLASEVGVRGFSEVSEFSDEARFSSAG